MTPHLHILNDLILSMFSGSCTLGCGGLPLGSYYWELNRRGSLYRTIFCWRSQLFPLLGGQVTLTVLDDIVEFSGRR